MPAPRHRILGSALVVALTLLLPGAAPSVNPADSSISHRPGGAPLPITSQLMTAPAVILEPPSLVQRSAQAGALTLRNASRVAVRIELRMGHAASCDDAPPGIVRTLPPGKRWLIAGTQPICWRRALDAGASVPSWTPWNRRLLRAGERLETTP